MSMTWQTPKDVMRKIKLKKKGLVKHKHVRHEFKPSEQFIRFLSQGENTESPALKRRKVEPETNEYDDMMCKNQKDTSVDEIDLNNKKIIVTEQSGVRLPSDWTIKTKVRIISSSPFVWSSRVKGPEEAASTMKAIHCDQSLNSSDKIELNRCMFYWQYPEITWLKMFPRYGTEYENANPNSTTIPQNDMCKNTFYDSWVCGLRSAFHLLKEDLCPYFYICAQTYTALFRSKSVSDGENISCVITPTSLGFRQSLNKENIEFTMPCQIKIQDIKEVMEIEEDNKGCHGDEEMWKDVSDGINFETSKVVKQAMRTDTSMHTAIFVEGSTMINLLYNYLINSKNSIAVSGPQTGIPPTILSPVGFLGATLKKLSVKSGAAKVMASNTQKPTNCFSLDITGPILPSTFKSIISIVCKTQREGFTLNCTNTKYSIPFNALNKKETKSKQENGDEHNSIPEGNKINKTPQTIREIDFKKHTFTWKV